METKFHQRLSDHQTSIKSEKKFNIGKVFASKTLLFAVIILQLIIIILLLNPRALIEHFQNQQLINELASKTTVNTSENPVIALISSADQLRGENEIQKEIYKDAQNGDYVIGFSDKMIIYRRSEGRIIYEGDSPAKKLSKDQELIVKDIIAKAKEDGIIDIDSSETPQISVITDAKALRGGNPTFYSQARNNDIIALFPQSEVIIIYSQQTNTIINTGSYQTTIR